MVTIPAQLYVTDLEVYCHYSKYWWTVKMLFHTCHCCPCISARGHNFYHLQWDFFCINLKLWLGRFLNMDFNREPNKRLQVRWSNIWVIHYFQKRYKGINERASFVLIQFVHYKELVQSMIQFFNLHSMLLHVMMQVAAFLCKFPGTSHFFNTIIHFKVHLSIVPK